MAVGTVQYGEYGITPIDTYSSSTGVSSFDLDINSVGEDCSFMIVQGTIQHSDDNQFTRFRLIDSSGSLMSIVYRVKTAGTTSTLSSNTGTTSTTLSRYTVGNQNNTVFNALDDVNVTAAEMVRFQMFISNERSTSAPIRNLFGTWRASHYSITPTLHTSKGAFRCITDGAAVKIGFAAGSMGQTVGTVTGDVKAYAIYTKN